MSENGVVNIPSYKLFDWNKQVHQAQHRWIVVNGGRQLGKSSFSAAWITEELAKYYNRTQHSDGRAWVVAPTYPLVKETWLIAKDLLSDLIVEERVADWTLVLPFGRIEYKSADEKDERLRGPALVAVVVEEAARVPREAWTKGLRATLASKRGRALFISTPKGLNWFYDKYLDGQHGINNTISFSFPSSARPTLDPDEVEEMRHDMPSRVFRQEVLAEFLADGGLVFDLTEAIEDGRLIKEPNIEDDYVIGVDVAEDKDFFVMAVYSRKTRLIVDLHRSNQTGWVFKREIIEEWAKTYNNAMIIIDTSGSSAGNPIEEDLRRAGLYVQGYKISNISKVDLVNRGMIAFERGFVRIPREERTHWLIDELTSFEQQKTPSGNITYSAPIGRHDDGVIALLLALWGARHSLYENFQQEKSSGEIAPITYGQLSKYHDHQKKLIRRMSPSRREDFFYEEYQWLPLFLGGDRKRSILISGLTRSS